MSNLKTLVDWALKNSGDADRYHRRMISNPTLAKFGCLPPNLAEISNNDSPWFCHGLAFRMATYSNACDDLFDRWETLFKLAQKARGWCDEYKHWSDDADHWAKKHDRFHQFLWLLQCYEYFSQLGHNVSFPATGNSEAMPDLFIERQGQEEGLYAECYYYSKWWSREEYFQQLLRKIDENLVIKRKHNVLYKASDNPFSSDERLIIALNHVVTALTQKTLAELQSAAQQVSPQKVCEIGDFRIVLKGEGEYQPDTYNAHGDPNYSLPVYLKEIIAAKKNSNNLTHSRPNIVMTNVVGLDFQFGFPESPDQLPVNLELPCSLDEIWIHVCSYDGKLETCEQVLKLRRK